MKKDILNVANVGIVIVVLFLISSYGVAYATVSSGSLSASSTSDLVVGTENAKYNVSFLTDTTATATTITVTFPSGFSVTNGSIATSTGICNSGCVATSAITVNDATFNVNTLTGDSSARTITIGLASTTTGVDLSTGTTTFRLLLGITNATTSGATATSSITTDATGETAQTNVSGVTLTAGTVVKLAYATSVAHSGTPNGDVISGIAFATQPAVAGQDQYGNTNTSYTGTVTLSTTGSGTLGGTLTEAAVSGIADFSGNGVKYTTSTDQGTFRVIASQGSLDPATSSLLTADVVGTKLAFTTAPNNGVTGGIVFGTQPVVTVQDADNTTDTDSTASVSLSGSSNGSFSGNAQAAVAGVATFANLTYYPSADSEIFTITAAATGLTSATSGSITARFFKGVGGGGVYTAPAQPSEVVVAAPSPAAVAPAPSPVVTSPSPSLSATPPLSASLPQAVSVPAVFLRRISLNSSGDDVKTLQEFFAKDTELYPEGLVTGYFGSLTQRAVQRFQEKYGIAREGSIGYGEVGPNTRAKLNELVSGGSVDIESVPAVVSQQAPTGETQSAGSATVQQLEAQIRLLQEQLVQLLAELAGTLQSQVQR